MQWLCAHQPQLLQTTTGPLRAPRQTWHNLAPEVMIGLMTRERGVTLSDPAGRSGASVGIDHTLALESPATI